MSKTIITYAEPTEPQFPDHLSFEELIEIYGLSVEPRNTSEERLRLEGDYAWKWKVTRSKWRVGSNGKTMIPDRVYGFGKTPMDALKDFWWKYT